MNNLWDPSKADRSSLYSGERKIRIYDMKARGRLTEMKCICGKDIYLVDGKKRMTLSGSDHKCKRLKAY